jgi:predicted DNA-binding protein (UPF0251 family)
LAILLAILVVACGSILPADEEKPAPKPAALSEDIARWLNDLSGQDFPTREQASRKLVDAGEAAIEPVAQLTDTDNLELAMRGLFILKEQMQSKQPGVKEAAKKALERLSASRRGSVAKRAQAILNPPADNPVPNRVNPGGIQFQFAPAIAGGARKVSVSSRTVNGHTDLTVNEDGTKVAISHTNGRDIVVKIKEPPKDGKEQPEKEFTAKDLDELKKQHPEAARFYERYATGNGNVVGAGAGQIPVQAPAIIPPAAPVRVIQPSAQPPLNLEQLQITLQEIEAARKELQALIDRLQALGKDNNANTEALSKLADEIRGATDRIKAARLKLLP